MEKFRQELVSIFSQNEGIPLWQKRIDKFIYLLILASSFGVILETIPFIKAQTGLFYGLLIFEDVAMGIFTIELILHLFVINRLYANCKNGWERFMLILYTFIDFIAILPAVLFAIGSEHHDYFLTLRLLRMFKVFRHDDSVELVLRAILIKKDILFKTAIIVLITTVFLSVFLYEAENKFEFSFNQTDTNLGSEAEVTQFTDIWASMVWCFSMFVGDLAGYIESGFMPHTPIGRFIAGILGFLNIAIVVIPTGIIASGFLEVLEEKKVASQHKILVDAFRPKYNPLLKTKLFERPRTMLTLQNALYIHQNNLFKILETKPAFRLRSVQSDDNEKYSDINLIEYFGYGTLTVYGVKRESTEAKITILCPDAFASKGIGYFGYAISELQGANLISNEKFQTNSLDIQYDASFLHNEQYQEDFELSKSKKELKKVPIHTLGLYYFKQDIKAIAHNNPLLIFVSDASTESYQIDHIDEVLSQENELFKWLYQNQLKSYLIKISQKRLDNYSYYDLIAEVSSAVEKLMNEDPSSTSTNGES